MSRFLKYAMVVGLVLTMLFAPDLICSAAQPTIKVTLNGTNLGVSLNGQTINFPDQKPYLSDGRAFVPVRFIAEALGAQIKWNDQQVNFEINDKPVALNVGSKIVTVNNCPIDIKVPVVMSGGRVMVPLGFVKQVLGAEIKWGPNESSQKTSDNGAKPILRVASETIYPPFEFVQNDQYAGYDMDLIRAIGDIEGYEIRIIPMGFDQLIPILQNNEADCVISAMAILPGRLQVVDASEPYFTDGLVVSVRQDNQIIQQTKDLQGKTLGSEAGTPGLDLCNDIKSKDPNTVVKVFDSPGEALIDLEHGRVDAVIGDWANIRYYIKANGSSLKTLDGTFQPWTDQLFSIFLKKGNSDLLGIVNDGLKKLKADGTMDELQAKWFD